MATEKKATEFASAAARKNYLDALKVELEGAKRSKNADREADIVAEIRRVAVSRNSTGSKRDTASTPPATA